MERHKNMFILLAVLLAVYAVLDVNKGEHFDDSYNDRYSGPTPDGDQPSAEQPEIPPYTTLPVPEPDAEQPDVPSPPGYVEQPDASPESEQPDEGRVWNVLKYALPVLGVAATIIGLIVGLALTSIPSSIVAFVIVVIVGAISVTAAIIADKDKETKEFFKDILGAVGIEY